MGKITHRCLQGPETGGGPITVSANTSATPEGAFKKKEEMGQEAAWLKEKGTQFFEKFSARLVWLRSGERGARSAKAMADFGLRGDRLRNQEDKSDGRHMRRLGKALREEFQKKR